MELNHNKHSLGGSNYHFQFTPKYRKPVFWNRRIQEEMQRLMHEKAKQLGVEIESIEFGPDHLHMFVTKCRKYSVSKLLQYFKGYSSYKIRRSLPYDVSYYNWGKSFWSNGSFYESIGRVTSDTVKFYIERQQKKHWIHSDFCVESGVIADPNQQSLDAFYS